MLVRARPSLREPLPDGRVLWNFTPGKLYVVISLQGGMLRLVDDRGEPILAEAERFEIVDSRIPDDWRQPPTTADAYDTGPAELDEADPEAWHDGDPAARRAFAQLYERLWRRYADVLRAEGQSLPDPWGLWRRHFPRDPPLGHRLREAHLSRWCRVNFLDGNRRLPRTQTDRTRVLSVFNGVAEHVIGAAAPSLALLTCWVPQSAGRSWRTAPPPPEWPDREGLHDELSGAQHFFLHAPWRARLLDKEVARIAQGELGRLILMAEASGSLIAPYDGGVDVLVSDPDVLCDRLRACGMKPVRSPWMPGD